MDVTILTQQNPWWKGKESIESDEDYRKWKESKIKWTPEIIDKIGLESFSLHFIFGPRQVGKTTLVKLLIKKLLDVETKPESIFYFKCDKLEDFKELDEVIKTYFEYRREKQVKNSYIFFDEITFPKEWFRTIKFHIDVGNFRNDVLVLTGSLSMVAKGEIETFPGRRGKGKDLKFYPLSFREFVKIVSPETFQKLPKLEDLTEKELCEKCVEVLPFINELNSLFAKYLKCGGLPLSIKSFLIEGKISDEVKETYLSWLKGDLAKVKRSPETARRIIKGLLEKAPSTISWLNIAKEFELKSHRSVYQYINLLSELFVTKVLYFIDPNKGRANFDKYKKAHFTDPFFFELFSYWCLTEIKEESVIVENTVASHLARKYEVFHWKNNAEIDIVIKDGKFLRGFEVKWLKKPEIERKIIGKIKEITLLTKEDFKTKPLTIPVSTFLACLEL